MKKTVRIGWTYLGVYPIPTVDETTLVSGLMLPTDLTEMTSRLQIADAWNPHLVKVIAGLLMLSRERRYTEGVARIMTGLGLRPAGPMLGMQEGVDVAN